MSEPIVVYDLHYDHDSWGAPRSKFGIKKIIDGKEESVVCPKKLELYEARLLMNELNREK